MKGALTILFVAAMSSVAFPQSANDLAGKVLANELNSERGDHSLWMLRLHTHKPNAPEEIDEVVETKNGDLKYPLLIDGRSLTKKEQQAADARIDEFVRNPDSLRKSLGDKNSDEEQSQKMLELLPKAFNFQYGQRRGSLTQLRFTPNPYFHPPTHEAKVFHAMRGDIWVDTKANRLIQMEGTLSQEVKFGAGVLGHLDKGGHFYVKQQEVAPGYWELTMLNVQMNGKAVFFKTISVQQKYSRTQFKQLAKNLTVAEAATILRKKVSASNDARNSSVASSQ